MIEKINGKLSQLQRSKESGDSDLIQRLLVELEALAFDNLVLKGRLHMERAELAEGNGDFDIAQEELFLALETFQQDDHGQGAAFAAGSLGALYGRIGDLDISAEFTLLARDLFLGLQDVVNAANCDHNIARSLSLIHI